MFRVPEYVTGFSAFQLDAEVIYATGMNGLEVGSLAQPGVIYADGCNWILDIDRNGRVEAHTDGVILYRALKYGDIYDWLGCPLVPIIPPDYAAAAGEYLPCDATIAMNVQYELLPNFDFNVDDKSPGPTKGLGDPDVTASRDGVYVYRNLGAWPNSIYPVYNPPNPFTPFVNPSTPAHAGNVTVPAGHTDNLAAEAAIDGQIDLLKVLYCDWMLQKKSGGKLGVGPAIDLPYDPLPDLPCLWILDWYEPIKTLPLPQDPWTEPCSNGGGIEN
jgi:hypothetical protein